MNDLQRAYKILGLDPGSDEVEIERSYKQLSIAFHPSRFDGADDKARAEQDLKKFLRAKELLLEHFKSDKHQSQNCECLRLSSKPQGNLQLQHVPTQVTPARQNSGDSSPSAPSAEQIAKWNRLEKEFEKEEKRQQMVNSVKGFLLQEVTIQNPVELVPRKRRRDFTIEDELAYQRGELVPADTFLETWMDLYNQWGQIMLSPVVFFQNLPLGGRMDDPIRFFGAVALINWVCWFITRFIIMWITPVKPGAVPPELAAVTVNAFTESAMAVGCLCVFTMLFALTTNLLAKGMGGKGTYKDTYRAICYAFAPNVVLWLPIVNLPAALYSLILTKTSLEYVHKLHSVRCTSVIGIQLLVAFIAGLILMSLDMAEVAMGIYHR